MSLTRQRLGAPTVLMLQKHFHSLVVPIKKRFKKVLPQIDNYLILTQFRHIPCSSRESIPYANNNNDKYIPWSGVDKSDSYVHPYISFK